MPVLVGGVKNEFANYVFHLGAGQRVNMLHDPRPAGARVVYPFQLQRTQAAVMFDRRNSRLPSGRVMILRSIGGRVCRSGRSRRREADSSSV